METENLPFNRHAELPWPDLPLLIPILFNIRLLLGKNHWKRYLQPGKIIDTINWDIFLCVVIKESCIIITVFRGSVLTTGMLLSSSVRLNSTQHLTEQKQTEEMLFAFRSFHFILKNTYILLCRSQFGIPMVKCSQAIRTALSLFISGKKNFWIFSEDNRTQN